MFSRVLKHEWAALSRNLSRVLLIAGLVLILGCVAVALRIPIMRELGYVSAVVAIIALPVAGVVLAIREYWRSLYGARGYLTHTLPVPASHIYGAKLLGAVLQVILTCLLALVALNILIVARGISNGDVREAYFRLSLFFRQPRAIAYTVGLIVFLLYSLVVSLIHVFYSMSKGAESRWQRLGIGGPVIVYIILYAVMQGVGLALTFLVPLGVRLDWTEAAEMGQAGLPTMRLVAGNMLQAFTEAMRTTGNETGVTVGLGSQLAGVLFALVLAFLTSRSIARRTSLR